MAKYDIGFSQCLGSHPWRVAMNESMQLKASLNSDIALQITQAEADIALQIKQIESMIAAGKDAIIVSPLDADSLVPVLNKAFAKNIPIILIDRKVNSENYTAFIGGDNLQVGRNVGNYIVSQKTAPLHVMEIRGGDNSSPAKERSLGFYQVVDEHEDIQVVKSFQGFPHDEILKAFKVMGDSIDYVYGFNDDTTLNALRIAQQLGLSEKIKFIGVDGLNLPDGGVNMVARGDFVATVLYPTAGAEAIDLTLDILEGKDFSKRNILSTTLIDRINVDIMKDQFDKINEQQHEIEEQVNVLAIQKERYSLQKNILQVVLILFIITICLTIYSIFSIRLIRRKNRQLEITNEKVTTQRNQIKKIANEAKESNEARMNFFTGISHEFKTPITLIQSSIESIAENKKLAGSFLINEVELIYNNSNRLLRLINNLLDFRKVEDRTFNLRVSKTNLFKFSALIYKEFEREAKKRDIKYTLKTNNEEVYVYMDRNLMDKAYFNLLSNAFKFTPDHGKIHIEIKDYPEGNEVKILFKDSGIGIPQEELANVFDAFFRGAINRKNSSGIGLNLTKQFIDLHLGKIEVHSHRGTQFIITLFKGKTHFNEDHIIDEPEVADNNSIIEFAQTSDKNFLPQENVEQEDKFSILIIEDNTELQKYLEKRLSREYITLKSDGADALDLAFEHIPDIILCDVNIVGHSGYEVCKILKSDLRTSHIPTVMLTALGDKDSYLKGLQSGADLYLVKPFSFAILQQSLKSIIYNREKLKFYYMNNIHKIEQKENFGTPEQNFIQELNQHIRENLDNSDFNVEILAKAIGISRVQLYRKVKALLGVSVSEYMTDFKLEKARSLLKSSTLTIAEIAYKCGFSSPNYFSTSFKNKYGITPAATRKAQEL